MPICFIANLMSSIHAQSPSDAQDASVKHLGVPLSRQPEAAATALYSAILRKVEVRIARWSGFRLSLLGRAYVAKQLLASMVTYHATFIPVPSQLEKRLCTALHTFVAANRPVLGGTSARLYPGKDTCFHAVKDGGIAQVDLRAQILPAAENPMFNVPYAFACDTMPIESTNCQQKDSGQRTVRPKITAGGKGTWLA
ncbi:hypothetical protein COCOBI_05-4060 [Coccomyxa sp. Obi]|nr:hypothetical protein COCOBI_05-4060 [Coccomyxa sp. Obi]